MNKRFGITRSLRRAGVAALAVTFGFGTLSIADQAGAIVGGGAISITKTPWQVSLQTADGFICGGTILNERTILTAAHCTVDSKAADLSIRAGVTAVDDTSGQDRRVARILQHPLGVDAAGDIAILGLEAPLTFNASVQPIALASAAELGAARRAFVSGWGATSETGDSSPVLKGVEMSILSDSACSATLSGAGGAIEPSRELCTDGSGIGSCYGDSGGPLVITVADGSSRLAGVVNWGIECATSPDVYAEVPAFGDWIRANSTGALGGSTGTTTTPTGPTSTPTPTEPSTTSVEVDIAGYGGVPSDASGAVLNVTAVGATSAGYLTLWPCGTPRPDTSNVNYAADEDTPNLVVSKLGIGGKVCIETSTDVEVLVDVVGFFPASADYSAVQPVRTLDTRSGNRPGSGEIVEAAVTGGTVPGDAVAVVLNLTATGTSADGFVSSWPCGEAKPVVSSLNYRAGHDRANLVVAKVGLGGKVCLQSSASVHMLVDVAGYFPKGTSYTPLVQRRILDTRGTRQVSGGSTVEVTVPVGSKAIALNVTATRAAGAGFATVWPCGQARPATSNLNFPAHQDAANAVVTGVGSTGKICIFSDASADFIVDLNGSFPAASSYTSLAPVRLLDTRNS